jgi:hypothetical protein
VNILPATAKNANETELLRVYKAGSEIRAPYVSVSEMMSKISDMKKAEYNSLVASTIRLSLLSAQTAQKNLSPLT